MPNPTQTQSQFRATDSTEEFAANTQQQVSKAESLRNEHTRVHCEDQNLLKAIRAHHDSLMTTNTVSGSECSPSELAKRNEDRAALLASKAYAVVTRNDPYEHLQLEEDFCHYLLERVVMMRELPLMKTALNLERNQQQSTKAQVI